MMRIESARQDLGKAAGISVGLAYLLTFFLSNASLNPIDNFIWSIFTHGKLYPDAATFYASTVVSYVVSLLALSMLISSLLQRLPVTRIKIDVGSAGKVFQFVGAAVPILLPITYFGFLWDRHDIEQAFALLIYVRRNWAGIGAVIAGLGLLLAALNTAFEIHLSVKPRPRFAGATAPRT